MIFQEAINKQSIGNNREHMWRSTFNQINGLVVSFWSRPGELLSTNRCFTFDFQMNLFFKFLYCISAYSRVIYLLFNYHHYLVLLFNYHQYLVFLFNYHQYLVFLFNYHQYLVLLCDQVTSRMFHPPILDSIVR